MLKLDAVTAQSGTFRLEADLMVQAGQKVAVIGPSGAGKSTLIEAISGFSPITHGRIFWQDADITATVPGARPVSTLFQEGNLFPHLSVRQNVALGMRSDLKITAEQNRKVDAALVRVGLAKIAERRPAALSGGQQSRAALARVLVQGRPLLLLDEPFAALGPALKADMLDLVSELVDESGATLLMVSHDPSDARRIADQVILVEGGRAEPPQNTARLLDNPPPALQAYLGI